MSVLVTESRFSSSTNFCSYSHIPTLRASSLGKPVQLTINNSTTDFVTQVFFRGNFSPQNLRQLIVDYKCESFIACLFTRGRGHVDSTNLRALTHETAASIVVQYTAIIIIKRKNPHAGSSASVQDTLITKFHDYRSSLIVTNWSKTNR